MTLKEILDYVSEPASIDERVRRIHETQHSDPEFSQFLTLCFIPLIKWEEITSMKGFSIKTINGTDNFDWKDALKELISYADHKSNMKARIRRSKIIQVLDSLPHTDGVLLHDMIQAKYNYNDKINLLVLKSAWPELFTSKNV